MRNPAIKLRPVYEELLFCPLGIFKAFVPEWMMAKPAGRPAIEKRYYQILRQARWIGYEYVDFFLYVSDGRKEHKFNRWRTPFYVAKCVDGKKRFNLTKPNPEFFECLDVFLGLVWKAYMKPKICLEMWFGYTSYPYAKGNNTNDVNGFTCDKAIGVHLNVAKWTVEAALKWFKPEEIEIRPLNEPTVGGVVGGWWLAEYHRIIYDEALAPLGIPLSNVKCDATHKDYVFANLIGPELHHGRWWGNKKYLDEHGRRQVHLEKHNLSVAVKDKTGILGPYADFDMALKSGFIHLGDRTEDAPTCKLNFDGTERCPSGHLFGSYRTPNEAETEETAYWTILRTKLHRKEIRLGFFTLSAIIYDTKLGIWTEKYIPENIEWNRMRAQRRGVKKARRKIKEVR